MTLILLIRHAETAANAEGRIPESHPGPGLTLAGSAAAAALRCTLAERFALDAMVSWSSPALRARQTAHVVMGSRPDMVVDDDLNEVHIGRGETTDLRFIAWHDALVHSWCLGARLDEGPRGGENGYDVLSRIARVEGRLDNKAKSSVVIFSHYALIRVWISQVLGARASVSEGQPALLDVGIVQRSRSDSHFAWLD